MSFYYLLLGHLLGDFTFQTDKIAENKNKQWRCNLIHIFIVTLSMSIFALPFGTVAILLVFLNGFLHYFIDSFKSKLSLNNSFTAFLYFLFDQSVHILIIYFLSLFIVPKTVHPTADLMIYFLIVFIFVLSFASIFNQFILKMFFPQKKDRFFSKYERSIGNINRVTLFFILIGSYLISKLFLAFIPVLLLFLVYFYKKTQVQWISFHYFMTKFIIDYIMSFIGALILYAIL